MNVEVFDSIQKIFKFMATIGNSSNGYFKKYSIYIYTFAIKKGFYNNICCYCM